MDFTKITEHLSAYERDEKRMFTTCSFQSHSIVLLHMLSRINKTIPVYFINTGYLFPDTIAYRDAIMERVGMQLVDIHPKTPKLLQRDAQGRLLFASDPDRCCNLNKVQPLDEVLQEYDIWINGVRADQSATRKNFKVEEPASHNVTRFHPMLDWNPRMIHEYLKEHELPRHPMEAKGYFSIGCEPCTRKFNPEMDEREGRWFGLKKNECGLNTDLVKTSGI